MEKFCFNNKDYNIITSLVDDTFTDLDIKITDVTKIKNKFAFFPIYFDSHLFWLTKVKTIERLGFSGINIKHKDGTHETIWSKFWVLENVEKMKK